jgi:hypothetical protein
MTEVLTPTELPSPYGNMSADEAQQGAMTDAEQEVLRQWKGFQQGMRQPRRAQTLQVYKTPSTPPAGQTQANNGAQEAEAATQLPKENAVEPAKPAAVAMLKPRPSLGPPRRSYSLTDKEPIPHHHRISPRINIMDLPGEVHYAVFDFLDPIDSTCLGLTNKHFYAIHRRMHGSVPLSTRRGGPNELEWAWHVAGAPPKNLVTAPKPSNLPAIAAGKPDVVLSAPRTKEELSHLRVRGQAYCRKCGVTRCELYKHLAGWMGDKMEYCTISEKYGDFALPTAKSHCSRGLPSNPHRCARHYRRKNKVTLL